MIDTCYLYKTIIKLYIKVYLLLENTQTSLPLT